MDVDEKLKLLEKTNTFNSNTEKPRDVVFTENDDSHNCSITNIGGLFLRGEISESGYAEIGQNETPRRSWKIGLLMAILSGILCTASNFLYSIFKLMPLKCSW